MGGVNSHRPVVHHGPSRVAVVGQGFGDLPPDATI